MARAHTTARASCHRGLYTVLTRPAGARVKPVAEYSPDGSRRAANERVTGNRHHSAGLAREPFALTPHQRGGAFNPSDASLRRAKQAVPTQAIDAHVLGTWRPGSRRQVGRRSTETGMIPAESTAKAWLQADHLRESTKVEKSPLVA